MYDYNFYSFLNGVKRLEDFERKPFFINQKAKRTKPKKRKIKRGKRR